MVKVFLVNKEFEIPVEKLLRIHFLNISKLFLFNHLCKVLKKIVHVVKPLENAFDFLFIWETNFSEFGLNGLVFDVFVEAVGKYFDKIFFLLAYFNRGIDELDLVFERRSKPFGNKYLFNSFHFFLYLSLMESDINRQ